MNNTQEIQPNEETTGVTLQVLLTISIFLINLIFGLVPLFCKKCILNSSFIGIANAFSGGIFLSTGLFHLIPESLEKFEEHWEKNPDSSLAKYPNTLFLACMSYVLILFVEKVAFDSHSLLSYGHSHQHHNHEALSQCNDVANPNSGRNNNHSQGKEIELPEANTVINVNRKKNLKRKTSHRKRCRSVSNERSVRSISLILSDDKSSNLGKISRNKREKNKNSCSIKVSNPKNPKSNAHELENPAHDAEGLNKISNVSLFVLLIALSIHGIFEGIALGLQTHKDDFIIVYLAIICHKWAESFTLSQSLSKSPLNIYVILSLIFLFSLITPIGVIIGILVSDSNMLVEAVILSLSGGEIFFNLGTFIYVSTSELIVEEFSTNSFKYYKFLALILGAIIIAITKIIEENGVDHHH